MNQRRGAVLILPAIVLFFASCQKSSTMQPEITASNDPSSHKNRLLVIVGGKRGYIDKAGKLVINPQWDSSYEFSEGLAVVCVGNCDMDHYVGYRYRKDFQMERLEQSFKYGYINEDGQMVVNPMFESARSFGEGLAAVCVGHGCYIKPLGETKQDGEEQKWGFIDKAGKMVIPPQFANVNDFHEGLAAASVGDKWGYIDKTGKFVINPQ